MKNYLPFSHIEVVHGKSMMHRCGGSLINLQALETFILIKFVTPVRNCSLWVANSGEVLRVEIRRAIRMVKRKSNECQDEIYFTSQLNQLYKDHRCLWEIDTKLWWWNYRADNRDRCCFPLFVRKERRMLVCVFNQSNDLICWGGLPVAGVYEEIWS